MSFADCFFCNVPLLDDPHWHTALAVACCDGCCDAPGCQDLPGDGSATAPGTATGDDSAAIHGAVVPVAGEALR